MEKIFKIFVIIIALFLFFSDASQIENDDILNSLENSKKNDFWELNFQNKNYFGDGEITHLESGFLYIKSRVKKKDVLFKLSLEYIGNKKKSQFQEKKSIKFKANLRKLDINELTIEGILLKVF